MLRLKRPCTEWENGLQQKSRKKWEGKWKMAPGPTWPRNGNQNGKMHPKMGFWPDFGHFFHLGSQFSAISGVRPFSIFFPVFPGFLLQARLPFCKWPFQSQVSWLKKQELRREAPFTGVSGGGGGLRAQNRKKISKKVFLGVRRKVSKKTRKSLKIPIVGPLWVFLDIFGSFLGLFCRPAKRPFLRFFCGFGPGNGSSGCKTRTPANFHKIQTPRHTLRAQRLKKFNLD